MECPELQGTHGTTSSCSCLCRDSPKWSFQRGLKPPNPAGGCGWVVSMEEDRGKGTLGKGSFGKGTGTGSPGRWKGAAGAGRSRAQPRSSSRLPGTRSCPEGVGTGLAESSRAVPAGKGLFWFKLPCSTAAVTQSLRKQGLILEL